MILYKKITGNSAKQIIPVFDLISDNNNIKNSNKKSFSKIKSISICNTHTTNDAYIDIYYSYYEYIYANANNFDAIVYPQIHPTNRYTTTTTDYYLAKELLVEHGNTLVLEPEDFIDFDNKEYSLSVKLKAADGSVDIIINKI